MATGTTAVQVIGIAASPFITRLYGPEAFGIFGIFIAILSIMNPVATFTYSTAIVLPKTDTEAGSIVKTASIATLIIAGTCALMLILFKDMLIAAFGLHTISGYVFLIPMVVLFIGAGQIMNQWLIRKAQYKKIALLSILKALVINLSKVGVGLVHATAAVLIVLASFGYMLQALLLYLGISWGAGKDAATNTCNVRAEGGREQEREQEQKQEQEPEPETEHRQEQAPNLRQTARKFRNFPLYRAPQMLLGAFTKGIPLLLLAHFFGPAAAGFFAIANRVLQLPAGIIGKSIGSVFYPKVADASNQQKNVRPYILRATGGMAALALLPLIVVGLFGPVLFEWVFGQGWGSAGHYARWLAILVFFEFILHPSKDAMLVAGMQRSLLVFEGLFFVIKTAMLITGFYLFQADVPALIMFSLAGVAVSVLMLLYAHKNIPASITHAYN